MASLENVLWKSEENIRALFNGIPMPTYVWQFIDDKLILIEFNRAADEYTHGSIKNSLGVKASEFYHDRQDILDDLNICLKTKEKLSREMEYTFRSGEKKFLTTKYAYISPDIVLVHTEDISERIRIEQELKKSNHDQKERIKELLCLYGISELTLKLAITDDELIQGTLELIPPSMEYPELALVEIRYGEKIFRTNNFKETPWCLAASLTMNETVMIINIYYLENYPFLAEERHLINEIIHRLEIILVKKKVENDLEKLNLEIMTNIAEGIYLIRLEDGIIVYTNPRFEEMFGYNPGEMIGKNVVIVNAPTNKSPEETKEIIETILIETGEWHGEVKNIKKDGNPFWCYANVSLFDHPEHGTVMVSVITDINERKRAEEKHNRKTRIMKAIKYI